MSLLLAMAALVSGNAAVAPETAAPAAKPVAEKKICRKLDTTGSRLGSGDRVCRTKAQWDAIDNPQRKTTRTTTSSGN